MSALVRITAAADKIMARDDWDKRLALLFLVALVEVVFRGGKALDCGLEDEQ